MDTQYNKHATATTTTTIGMPIMVVERAKKHTNIFGEANHCRTT